MKLKLEKRIAASNGGQFNEYLIKNEKGEVVGSARKGKAARGYSFPWQAFALPTPADPLRAELIGSFYEGGKAAMLAAVEASLKGAA